MTQNIGQITLEQDLESENCTKEEQFFGTNTFLDLDLNLDFLFEFFFRRETKLTF